MAKKQTVLSSDIKVPKGLEWMMEDFHPITQQESLDNSQDFVQGFEGDSQYDDGLTYGSNQQDVRAANQGIADKLANGLAHGLTTAGTSVVGGTVGLGHGLLNLMSGESFFENGTFKALDEINKSVVEATPLYQDRSEREGGFVDSVLTNDDFWIDSVFNGLGFVAGGMATGYMAGALVGKGLQLAKFGKSKEMLELATKAGMGVEEAEAFGTNMSRIASKVPNITAATVGRIYESTIEANQVFEQLQGKIDSGEITEAEARQVRNSVFGANMLLGTIDFFQYTKFLDNFSNQRSALNKIVNQGGKLVQEAPTKGFKAGVARTLEDLSGLGASIGSEAAEEGAQNIISNTGQTGNSVFSDELINQSVKAFSDPEFYASMLAGGAIGGIMGSFNEFGKAKKKSDYTDKVIDLMNKSLPNLGEKLEDAKKRAGSYYNIEAQKSAKILAMNDPKATPEKIATLRDEVRVLEHQQLTNFVQAAQESKTFDDKIQELELISQGSEQEIKDATGIVEDKIVNGEPKNVKTILRERIQELKKLRQTYQNLAESKPNVPIEELGNMFKAQTTYEYVGKKKGIVDTKLAEENATLARIELEGHTPQEADTLSKPVKERISALVAEKEQYEAMQIEAVKAFNTPKIPKTIKQKFTVSPTASAPINKAAQQVASQQVSKQSSNITDNSIELAQEEIEKNPYEGKPKNELEETIKDLSKYKDSESEYFLERAKEALSNITKNPQLTEEELAEIQNQAYQDAMDEAYSEEESKDTSVDMGDLVGVKSSTPTPQVTPENTTQKPTAKEQLVKRTARMKELLSEGKTITEAGNIAAEEFPLDPLDSVLDSFEPGNTTGNLEKLQSEIDKLNNQADKLYSQETKLVLNAANMFIKEKLSQKDKAPLTAEDVENNLPSVVENQPHLIERIVGMVNAGMGLVVTPSKASVANTQTIEPVVSTKEIEEEAKEKLFESNGFKITTGHTAATKIVATDSNNNPIFENGRIKFEDNEHTPAYVKMHTNQVQIGEDWEIVLNNEAEELDDLELELIYTNPITGEKESRGFVHKEAYITEENTTLVGEELQKEKERIRAIRQFYKDKGTGKKVRVTSVTLAKPEFNERAEVASLDGITPDMMKKVVVRGDSKFITVDGATFNGSVEGDGELISGAIYFLAPQATHVNNGITHLPILLTKKTFNTHGKENKFLNEIRENIKKELLGVLNGVKLPTNSFTDQFIFIDNSGKPSDEYRIVIKGNTIDYAGGQIAKTEKDLDNLLNNVKFNFNSKGDQAYRDQVQKAGLLVSNLATLESGGTKLYAFQPTYIFEEISIANPATITSETKIEETPPIVEKEIVVEEDGQVQESNLPEIQRELEKEGIILDWEVNEGLDSLEVNPEVENSNVISLVEDASVVDSLAFQVIQDLRLNPEAKTTVDSLKAKFERAIGILEKVTGSEAKVRKAQEHIAVFRDVLDRFDTLKVKAEEKLQKMNFGKNKQGFYEDILDQQDSPSQYQDGSAYMENRLDSMPAMIRKLMSFIADYTAKGEIKRNVVGMPTFVPLDMIETIVSEILTPEVYVNSKDSLNKMIDLLGQSQNPAVKELHQILSTTKNLQLKQQFYKVFSVERDKPESFVFSDEDDDVKLRKTASDNTSGEAVIRKEWVEAMKANSNLVNEKGELNKDFVKSLANRLRAITTDKNNFSKNAGNKELKKAESLTISTSALFEVVRILKDLGLDVNIQTVHSWLVGDKNYKGKRDDRDHITSQLGKYFFKILEDSKTLDGFIDETSSQLTSLAHHSGITGTRMIGGSYRVDGDTYSVHANSKPMTEKLDWIKSKWEELKEHKVYKHLYSRLNEMKVITDRGFRKNKKGARPKMMKDSNEEEFELMRILMFQQFGQLKTETHSDKTTNFTVTGSTRNDLQILSIQDDGVYGISEQVVRSLYNYFNMEVAKIQTYKTRMANSDLLKLNGVDSTEDTKGAGEYFMYNEQLNAEILAESTDKNDKKILDALYDKNKNGVYRLKDTIDLSPEVTALIRNKIKDRFRAIVKETRDTWKQFGVYETKNGKVSGIKFMSNEYKNRLLSQYTHVKDPADRLTLVMQHAYTDYAFNYVQSLLETNFILGDPAQQSKIKVSQKPLTAAQVLKGIEDTFVNVSKRNARLLAQGGRGAWRKTNYKTQIFNDLDTDSRNVEQYLEEIQKAYKGDKSNELMTDAQEFTTVLEHLEDRLENGEIDFKEFEAGMLMFDPEHYQELLKDPSFKKHYPQASMRKVEIKERNHITSMGILQPRKPVQVFSKLEGGLIQEYYIKTSSIPIVPALVENSPFKKVLEMMKKNDVQRMTFNSAVKIGQSGVQNLFNEDGSVNEEGFSSPVELNRSGYHIQLNVPYDEDKHAIRQGSQVLKLLFVDLPEFVTIDGKQVENELRPGVTVRSLKKQYRDLQIKMVNEGKESLLKEVLEEADISVEDGKYVIRNATKLSKILKEAGKDRDFIENSLKMLNVDKDGNMLFPLSFNPNADKIQPLLNALITNTVMRQKIEGKSYVQVSEVMLYDKRSVKEVEDLTEAQKGGIVYTKPEYKGLKKLGYVVKGKDGEQTQMAQVYAPFFFKDQDGKKIPMSKFVVEGVLDLTRIPEDLLIINGFRIPTEGAKSMMMFEVVGFLPEAMGDTLIVPSEIAVQMGSDYDVDKLYTYNYEVDLNSIAEGDINKAVLSKRKESNSNELIDIHKEILLSAQMFDRLTTPQGFDGLLQAAEEVESLLAGKGAGGKKQWLGMYDPNYQRRVFFDNLAGKNGTAMAANANTFHALAQDADLYIKGIGFLFKDETGQYYDDSDVEENRVNEYKASSYPEGKKDDKNVWRLGKVTSFGGKSISNSISEWLAASVDNAKAKLLGRAGINDHNLAVGLTLVQAGFDNPLILSFINQPILKDYYLAMDGAKSMFNDKFEQDKVSKAIQDVVDKYVDKSVLESLGLEGYSLSEYQYMLGGSPDKLSQEQRNKQVIILKTFLHYKGISEGIRSVQSSFVLDSKGLPKNHLEVIEIIGKQNLAPQGSVGNVRNLENTVISPYINIPKFAEKLFSKIYYYGKPAYQTILSEVKEALGKVELMTDELNDIYNGIYSFVYSLPEIQNRIADGRNVEQYKKDLLNLAPTIERMKRLHPDNNFLRRIRVVDGVPVMENSFSTSDALEHQTTLSWLDMMKSNQQDAELKQLGLDLAAFTMFYNNSLFGVSNFMKYVPFEYYQSIGLSKTLQDLGDKLDNETYLKEFTKQYFQHNPELAKSLSIGFDGLQRVIKKVGKKEITTDVYVKIGDDSISITSDFGSETSPRKFFPFIKNYNRTTEKYDLYELVDENSELLHYKLISTLGDNAKTVSEYNFTDNNQVSNLDSNLERFQKSDAVLPEVKVEDNSPITNMDELVNHSGGAIGSDTQWDVIGKEFGMVNNKHYFTGEKGPGNAPLGNVDITNDPIAVEGASKVAQAAKQMWGYKYSTMKDQRLIRNWAQVANSNTVFAIGTLGNKGDIWKGDEKSVDPRRLLKVSVQGGTGYAVEMAIQAGKPVYLFDQVRKQWYKNIKGEWSKSEIPILTKDFAGIGTREINDAGKQAIRDVYEKTKSSISNVPIEKVEVKVEVPKVVPTKSTVKDSVLTKNGQLITDPKALLSNIQLQGSEYFRALAKHISDNLGTVTIVYDTLPDGKPANYFNGTVTLDPKQLGGKDVDNIQRIVLHEFDHALTASKLKDPEFQQTPEYVELKDMYQAYRDVLEKDGKLEEADKFWEIYKTGGKNFTESMKASHYIYYAAGSLDEFVTGVRSNPQVQAYMAGKLGVGKTKSVVNRIIQILKDALGIQKDSLLEDAYDAILKVVEYGKPVVETVESNTEILDSFELPSKVIDTLRKMNSKQLEMFRKLKSEGIFTTKCH